MRGQATLDVLPGDVLISDLDGETVFALSEFDMLSQFATVVFRVGLAVF